MKRSSETGAIGSLLGCCDELSSSCREPAHLGVAEALHEMVVDHPHRLHERIADRRADEPEAALDERGAHPIRFADRAGRSRRLRRWYCFGAPATKLHKNASNEPSCSTKARNARALDTAARTFWRLRTIPGSRSSCAIFGAL